MVINKKYDNYLVKLFFIDKWHFNLSNLNKYKRHYKKKDKYQNIINYIENRYDDSESFKETLYRICHNIEIRPVCQECGNKVEFIGKGNVLFRSFCSLSCSNGSKESIKKKQESDKLKNNGELGWVKSNRDPQKIENRKNTLIRKYGSLEIANKEINKLSKISFKQNTGYDNPMQNPVIKEKWKLSLYNKYGVNNPMKSEIITSDLRLNFSRDYINNEFEYYKNRLVPSLNNNPRKTDIIKFYQQNAFYINEQNLWKNDNIKIKIIQNRCKYLNKKIYELTSQDILDGFKRSGIYYGFSHFNSGLIKWFHTKYDSKICYDPCAGWGHRILGSLDIDLYIYNDLSKSTFENCKQMCNDLNIDNVILFNNDCTNFIPEYDFDTMFTCPPYFNLEHYECGDFESLEDYNNFIDSLFDLFYKKDSCKTFGLVIREDMINLQKYKPTESYSLNLRKSSHLTSTKSKNEYLYVYQK